ISDSFKYADFGLNCGERTGRRTSADLAELERNIVVGDGARFGRAHWSRRACRSRATLLLPAAHGSTAAFALRAAQQHHVTGANFGGFAFVAILVVPFARLQRTLDINKTAFAEIFVADLGKAVPYHDVVPFGAFLAFSGGLVVPGVVSGD